MENKKILGVIGGLGPLATAYFMELVIQMTDARVDQEHLPMIVYNMPMIPDRTAYILDNSKENPFPMMLEIGEELSRREVACIAIPCITAHYFMGGLQAGLKVPVINGVEETVAHLKANGIRIYTAQLQDSEWYYDTDMKGGTAIVMGTEATGLTDAWRKAADAHIKIPMLGKLDSLNVSVSAAILMFEAVRQRNS